MTKQLTVSGEIGKRIHFIRGQRVMLSMDLALLYGVAPRILIQAVKRNKTRFPEDFLFQLTNQEVRNLKSQNVILNLEIVRRANPYAFTEQGVAMLSSVLRSSRAVQVNIEIMRTFVKLRSMISTHQELAAKLMALEKKYDGQFKIVFDAIRHMMEPQKPSRRSIGF